MCGIAGIVALTTAGKEGLHTIEAATGALRQRGPDGGGVYRHENVALGHRRLSIIDTSDNGSQPMTTPDGRYTIVFNGEIFNYRELGRQYLPVPLHSHTDTEVLLHLFAFKGVAAFSLLEGFFAAAFYDKHTSTLTLVRDRFGEKPLLLYHDKDRLVFASEMKALFAAGIPRNINWRMLPLYLQLNYLPQPYSMVAGVRKLEPGHFLQVKDGQVTEQAWYHLELQPQRYTAYSYEAAQKELVRLMKNAVHKRLVSDVPLGAFLSGGIDSSVVVALAARHVPKLHTFSVGYKDHPFFDETAYARLVATRYGTEHTVFQLGNNDFLEHLTGMLDYIDEPFADSSALPVYILSRLTRQHVTVALSGDGGDELFGGYNKHFAEWKMRHGGWMNQLVQAGAPLWRNLPQGRNHPLTNKVRQLHRFAEGSRLGAAHRYWRWASLLDGPASRQLLHPAISAQVGEELDACVKERFTRCIAGADFNEVLLADMRLVLPGDMLVKVDSMSMANSLEVRSPFLDHQVVDFAFGLPVSYKVNSRMKKRIVQDAFRNLLPEAIYNRPKQGFEIPLLGWFRNELWALIDKDLLSDDFVAEQGIFNPVATRQLKQQIRSANPADSVATIWALLVFQYWWKRFMA